MTNKNEIKLFEVIFNIELDSIPFEDQYNSFLTIQVEDNVNDSDEAVEKAYEYAEKMFGIEAEKLRLNLVDEL